MAKSRGKERRTVRVDTGTFAVYPEQGKRQRIGTIVRFVTNEGDRVRTRGKLSKPFTSRKVTVRFPDDDRDWVGTFKSRENRLVILAPLVEEKVEENA